jgi:5-methylcytosine-specific restriction endonuclease McrA
MAKPYQTPSKYRKDIILMCIRGLSPTEISLKLGCPKSAITRQTGDANKRLTFIRKDQKHQKQLISWFNSNVKSQKDTTRAVILEILGVYPPEMAKLIPIKNIGYMRKRIKRLHTSYKAEKRERILVDWFVHNVKTSSQKSRIKILLILGLAQNIVAKMVGCAEVTVSRTRNGRKESKKDFISSRVYDFCNKKTKNKSTHGTKSKLMRIIRSRVDNFKQGEKMFTVHDFIEKFEKDPICQLTGRKIDLEERDSWELDHIIPKSRGGDNSLTNCQVLCRDVNQAKGPMLEEEFISLCIEVLEHKGYSVDKK